MGLERVLCGALDATPNVAHVEAQLQIFAAGEYTFWGHSDHCLQLQLDGRVVIPWGRMPKEAKVSAPIPYPRGPGSGCTLPSQKSQLSRSPSKEGRKARVADCAEWCGTAATNGHRTIP